MNDALRVSSIECVRNLDGQRQQDLGIQRLPRDAVFQRHAVEIFHHDEGLTILLIDLVNSADVRVIQGGGGFGLALETAQSLGILGYIIGQKLEGYKTAELDVLSFVDDAHASAA